MARFRWLIWGLIFSVVLFLAIYFLIYTKVAGDTTVTLMLGNKDVSSLGAFFSKIGNVIISSLVLGFLLGLLVEMGSGKKE
jgi:hypothetical protein